MKKRFLALLLIGLLAVSVIGVVPGLAEEKLQPMRYLTPGNMMQDADTALAAINAALQQDGLNIEVGFIRLPWDVYDQKLNVMLSSGEEFEMMHVMQDVKNITSLASREAIVPIGQYLDNYPNLVNKFTDAEWSAAMYKGEIYAVPARWKDFTRVYGEMWALGGAMSKVTDKSPTTVDELLDVMRAMSKEIEERVGKKPYHWVHQLQATPAGLHRTYETWPFYVENSLSAALIRQDGTVDSYYESDEFKWDAEVYRTMYTEGLINPDILSLDHTKKYDELRVGCALPSMTFGVGDNLALQENLPDEFMQDFFLAPEKPSLLYTLSQNLQAISATAEDEETGLKFLDWLYADKVNHDLFFYGIEGVHYTASAPNKISYIRGEDNENLYVFDTWMMGYLPYLRFDERYTDAMIDHETIALPESEYVISPAAAFLFDAADIAMELANLETEIKASIYPIRFGLVDYETAYPDAIERLKAAGLDAYMDAYRAQFAEYLAAQN